jgi:hypothetical protein
VLEGDAHPPYWHKLGRMQVLFETVEDLAGGVRGVFEAEPEDASRVARLDFDADLAEALGAAGEQLLQAAQQAEDVAA